MKAKPFNFDGKVYRPCDPKDATHLSMRLPCGCYALMLPVMIGGTRSGTPNWTWNGDVEKPTVKPSVLTRSHDFVCHSFINDGVMQFLSDTTGGKHNGLGGTNKPLLEIES
ncbi:MAG: DUF6527 family protein [Verrucomicrobiota bacterium]